MNVVDFKMFARRAATPAVESSFFQLDETTFGGHVFASADPGCKFIVEILSDGYVLQAARADLPLLGDDVRTGGDGCHGFRFSLPVGAITPGATIEARVANLDLLAGEPIVIDPDRPWPGIKIGGDSGLNWLGGLRFAVWTVQRDAIFVEVAVDGQPVTEVRPTGWMGVGDAGERPARLYDFHLPLRFADGAVHRVSIRDGGEVLGGHPLPFVAFDNGLAGTVRGFGGLEGERLRAELFDRLLPQSWPLSRYGEWRDRFPRHSPAAKPARIAVILTGGRDETLTIETLKEQSGVTWVAASLPAAGDAFSFAPDLLTDFLAGDGATADIIVLAPSGTRFAPDALRRLASGFDLSAETFAVYGDLEVPGADGAPWPLCFPAFDYERLLEQGYCALVFAMRRANLQHALEGGATSLFRLFNAQLDEEVGAGAGIVHVPGAIAALPRLDMVAASAALADATAAHLRRRDMPGEATAGNGAGSLPSVRVSRRQAPEATVAMVVMTDGRGDFLRDCLAAILPEARRHDAEIVIADTRFGHARTAAALSAGEAAAATVVTVDGPFSPARMANLAARSTERDYLCLIADDIGEVEPGWLDELLGRIADPCVGAVAPLLLGANRLVQSAGTVLGPNFSVSPAFANAGPEGDVYGGMLAVAHQQSAIGMGCLLTWRGDYLAVGGMDEVHFPFEFADVDFCLKLRAARRRIVVTPHARITRAGRDYPALPSVPPRRTRELETLRARWGEVLAADPYYSPLLSLDPISYSALAWPPRSDAPRRAEIPVPMSTPAGF